MRRASLIDSSSSPSEQTAPPALSDFGMGTNSLPNAHLAVDSPHRSVVGDALEPDDRPRGSREGADTVRIGPFHLISLEAPVTNTSIRLTADTLSIVVPDRLDADASADFVRAFSAYSDREFNRVLVDLDRCMVLHSLGANAIAALADWASERGASVAIRNVREHPRSVLELLALDNLIDPNGRNGTDEPSESADGTH